MNIHLRLYEELNDFLHRDKKKRRFDFQFKGVPTVRRMLACLGVPARQVELVLVNGDSAGFSHRLNDNDCVSLYPVFESFDVTTVIRARRKPLRRIRFIAGSGLSGLARRLRLLGFDTVDLRIRSPEKIVRVAQRGERILLTKDPALMKFPILTRIYLVRETTPARQLEVVLSRFHLTPPDRPTT